MRVRDQAAPFAPRAPEDSGANTHKKKVVAGLPPFRARRPGATHRGRSRAPLPGTGVRPACRRHLRGSRARRSARARARARAGRGGGCHLPCSSSLDEPELPSSQELLPLLPLGAAAKLLFWPLLGAAAAEAAAAEEEAVAAEAATEAAAEAEAAEAAAEAEAAAVFLPRRFPETSGPFSTMAGIGGARGRAKVTGTPALEARAPGRGQGAGSAGGCGAGRTRESAPARVRDGGGPDRWWSAEPPQAPGAEPSATLALIAARTSLALTTP
jgi:hypothetical protein